MSPSSSYYLRSDIFRLREQRHFSLENSPSFLSASLNKKVHDCKVLCVGAGGIGCELVKNLVYTGFRCIDVIDLDTIDVSNLNRQFLFRPYHVGKPKATIACEVILNMVNANDKETITKFPFFGDIPIIGHFFRNRVSAKDQRELVILVTPRLLDGSDDEFENINSFTSSYKNDLQE